MPLYAKNNAKKSIQNANPVIELTRQSTEDNAVFLALLCFCECLFLLLFFVCIF